MKFQSYVFALLALGFLAGAVLVMRQFRAEQPQEITPAVEAPKITEPEPTPSPSPEPAPTTKDLETRIAEGVNAKTYSELADSMINPVTVILYATECCGPRTPAQAALDMPYLDDGAPYDFDQTLAKIGDLKMTDPTNFSGTFIGLSKSGEKGVAFTINDDDKIAKVFIFASYKFFAP